MDIVNISLTRWVHWSIKIQPPLKILWHFLYGMRYLGRNPIIIYVRMWSHTLNNVRFLVINMSNEPGCPITKLRYCTHSGGIYRLLPMFYTSAYVWFANATVSILAAGRLINAWPDILLQNGVKIIVIPQLNDEMGWKSKKRKIQDGYR